MRPETDGASSGTGTQVTNPPELPHHAAPPPLLLQDDDTVEDPRVPSAKIVGTVAISTDDDVMAAESDTPHSPIPIPLLKS